MEHSVISVESYLRSQEALFLSSDCPLQLSAGEASSFVDMLAVDFSNKTVWLCVGGNEVMKTLRLWQTHWPQVQMALWRDHKIPIGFEIRPWGFVEQAQKLSYDSAFSHSEMDGHMPNPRFTKLEDLGKLMPRNRRRDDINGFQFAA